MQAQKMESIGQLTGGIAHDFNNMLSSILGFTQLSQKLLQKNTSLQDDKLKSYLDQILLASGRARDLVKQMLAFSRTDIGEVTTIDLDLIVEEVANMLRPILPSSIDFTIDTDTQDKKIDCDAVQLHQVLTNLCINARDAMSGAGTITLSTRILHPRNENCTSCHHPITGDYISLIVSDTGSGIPDEFLSRIFEPFVTTKEVGKGTGMGLSMVHGIIHQHHGHIIVDSTPGEGTSFTLLLPIATTTNNRENRHLEPVLQDTPSINPHPKHIMIVDDEVSLTRLFADILNDYNYRVTTFNDSLEALNEFQANPQKYDCIITDQTMPKLTGIELVKEITRLRKDLPIIMQTGYSEHITDETINNTGIIKLLKKPVNIDEIIITINQLFETCEQNQKSNL
jgi:CheY-like chemotaxis protein